MISKDTYTYYKAEVLKYEDEQARLAKVKGFSKCPFCGGTKTKPFVRAFVNQNCTDCNVNGMINNRNLVAMGLDDCIEKPYKNQSNQLLVA